MTLEEAVQWCDDHAVSVNFDFPVQIYDDLASDLKRNLLGAGETLVAAVQDAIIKECLPVGCQSIPMWMREEGA